MSDFDVLIIGGYGLTEKSGSVAITYKDRSRLYCSGHAATTDFLEAFVNQKGDVRQAEAEFRQNNRGRMVARSLNTIYLYDYLKSHGVSCEVLSYFAFEQEKFSSLMSSKPRVVAISTTFMSDVAEINEIARSVREQSPDSLIVAGGVKILKSYKKYNLFLDGYFDGVDVAPMVQNNYFFDPAIDEPIDIFVIEESGELALLNLARAVKSGLDIHQLPNLAYRDGTSLMFTSREPEPFTFDQHPISWETVPENLLGYEIPVRAGKGCPFKCRFCDFVNLHRVQLRDIDNLMDEIGRIQARFPGKPVYFVDDNIFTNERRTTRVAQSIIDRGFQFKWRGFFRCDSITEANIGLLKQAGLWFGALGVESGDNDILRAMDKRISAETTVRAVTLLNSAGISTASTLIVGFPGETEKSVQNTIDMLNQYPQTRDACNLYYPLAFLALPLAPVCSPESRRMNGLTGLLDKWEHNTMTSAQAQELAYQLTMQVHRPTLLYPESMAAIPIDRYNVLARTRDRIVKSGINVIDESNAQQVYKEFSKVFDSPQ